MSLDDPPLEIILSANKPMTCGGLDKHWDAGGLFDPPPNVQSILGRKMQCKKSDFWYLFYALTMMCVHI